MIRSIRPLRGGVLAVVACSLVLAGTGVGGSASAASTAADAVNVNVNVNGPAVTVALTPGQDGRVSFTGLAGQQVAVATTRGSFADRCAVRVSVRTAGGAQVVAPRCGGRSVTLPRRQIARSARYVVVLDAVAGARGSLDVRVTGTGRASLTPWAGPRPVTVPARSTRRLTFLAEAGDFVHAVVGSADGQPLTGSIALANGTPTGTETASLAGRRAELSTAARAAGEQVLAVTNDGPTPRRVSVALRVGRDAVVALVAGWRATASTTLPGQRLVVDLDVPAGHRAALRLSGAGIPDGALLLFVEPGSPRSEQVWSGDPVRLTCRGPGVCRLWVDPPGTALVTGSVRAWDL